jgi:NADPH:quinone reductase-like Zn-dependent oxidoreductase
MTPAGRVDRTSAGPAGRCRPHRGHHVDLRDLIYKDLEMSGVTCPTSATFARIVDLVQQGRLQALLEHAYPLARLADAQAQLVKRQHVGKFVVVP